MARKNCQFYSGASVAKMAVLCFDEDTTDYLVKYVGFEYVQVVVYKFRGPVGINT